MTKIELDKSASIVRMTADELRQEFQKKAQSGMQIIRVGDRPGRGWRSGLLAMSIGAALTVGFAPASDAPTADQSLYAQQSNVIGTVLTEQLDAGRQKGLEFTLTTNKKSLNQIQPRDDHADSVSMHKYLNENMNDKGPSSLMSFSKENLVRIHDQDPEITKPTCHVYMPDKVDGPEYTRFVVPVAQKMSTDFGVPEKEIIQVLVAASVGKYEPSASLGPERSRQIAVFMSAFLAGHEAGHCVNTMRLAADAQMAAMVASDINPERDIKGYVAQKTAWADEKTPDLIGMTMAYRAAKDKGASDEMIAGWIKAHSVYRLEDEKSPATRAPDRAYTYEDAGYALIGLSESIRKGEGAPVTIAANEIQRYYTIGMTQVAREMGSAHAAISDVRSDVQKYRESNKQASAFSSSPQGRPKR